MKNKLKKIFLFLLALNIFNIGVLNVNASFHIIGPSEADSSENLVYKYNLLLATKDLKEHKFEIVFPDGNMENLKLFCVEKDKNNTLFCDSLKITNLKNGFRGEIKENLTDKIGIFDIYVSGTLKDKSTKKLKNQISLKEGDKINTKILVTNIFTQAKGENDYILKVEDLNSGTYFYNSDNKSNLFKKIDIDGENAYCLEPGHILNSGKHSYNKEDYAYNDIKNYEKSLYSHFGYGNKLHNAPNSDLLFVATQSMIWENDKDINFISRNDLNLNLLGNSLKNLPSEVVAIENFKNDIKNLKTEYIEKNKLFLNEKDSLYKYNFVINYEISEKFYGEDIILDSDSEKLEALKNGTIVTPDGVNISIEGDKLKISLPKDSKDSSYEILYSTLEEKYLGKSNFYKSNKYQDLGVFKVPYNRIKINRTTKTKVITKYVEEGTNKEISIKEDEIKNLGDMYETSPKNIENYTLKITPENSKGTVKGITEVIYVYSKNPVKTPVLEKTKISIKYIDKDGKELLPSKKEEYDIGVNYSTNPEVISGYKLVSSSNVSGVTTKDEIKVTYVYDQVKSSTGGGFSPITPSIPRDNRVIVPGIISETSTLKSEIIKNPETKNTGTMNKIDELIIPKFKEKKKYFILRGFYEIELSPKKEEVFNQIKAPTLPKTGAY